MSITSAVRYALSELRDHYLDRNWYRDRLVHYGLGGVHRNIWPGYRGSVRVMDADWDTLIVLDACRRSLFESVVDVEATFDEYRTVRSLGSNTGEWTMRNFMNDAHRTRFGDTVYVAGNVVVSRRIDVPTFHRLEEVWAEAFDEDLGSVPPEPVVERAVEMRESHPDKRLIVHLLQPHQPFLGQSEDGEYTSDPAIVFGPETTLDRDNIWLDLAARNVPLEPVKRAYANTLKIAWKAVQPLLETLSERTVVTADHGNMWGELGFPVPVPVYGHPTQVRCPALVDVPWGVIESDDPRPEITEGGVRGVGREATDITETQLRALGYLSNWDVG